MDPIAALGLGLGTLLPGLVGAAIVSGATFVISPFYFEPRRKRRRRAAVLGFSATDCDFAPALIVGTTEPIETGVYLRPTVGYGSLLAVAYVSQIVGDVSPDSDRSDNLDVFLAGDNTAVRSLSRSDEHNILIGGPARNSETMTCLSHLNRMVREGRWALVPSAMFSPTMEGGRVQRLDEAISFPEQSARRALNVAGHEFVARLERSETSAGSHDLSGIDYGLIVRSAAPNEAGRVVLLAGVHTFGSAGAGHFLAELAKLRRPLAPGAKARRTRRGHHGAALKFLGAKAHQDLVLVVRSEVRQGLLASSMMVAAWRIESS